MFLGTPEGMEVARRHAPDMVVPATMGMMMAVPRAAVCLACHAAAADVEAAWRGPGFHIEEGVQCEACHGPGSRYVPFFQRLQAEGGTYRRSEVLALGLVLPDRSVCLRCHNSESPFVPKEAFDFPAMRAKGTHEHTMARQRVEEDGGGEAPK